MVHINIRLKLGNVDMLVMVENVEFIWIASRDNFFFFNKKYLILKICLASDYGRDCDFSSLLASQKTESKSIWRKEAT